MKRSRVVAVLAPGALAAGLLLAACGGGEPPPAGNAAASEPAKAAPPVAGGPPMTAPSPLPALNEFADGCARGGAPSEDAASAAGYATRCGERLLETLRAAVGAAGLDRETAGAALDAAELAVRRLAADAGGDGGESAAARLGEAAAALAALAAVLGAETTPMEEAAAAFDPGRPLAAQTAAVDAYLAAADAAVRPLVRRLAG